MAARKITFSLPEDLVARLVKEIPFRDRSAYVAKVLNRSLREREEQLIRSCELANADAEVRAIEEEIDRIADPIEEPWN